MASMPLMAATDLASLSLYATTVSTENCLSASLTLMVPMADDRRPEKGNTSGERLHCTLRLMRPTIVLSASTMGAVELPDASLVKMAACCPFQDALAAAISSLGSEKVATGCVGRSEWRERERERERETEVREGRKEGTNEGEN